MFKKNPNQSTGSSYSIPKASSSPSSSSKTLLVSDNIECNIFKDMKKTKANISLYEVSKLKQQQRLLLNALNAIPTSPLPLIFVTNKSPKRKEQSKSLTSYSHNINPTYVILIRDRSNSHTPPFVLTFEIFNKSFIIV